MKRIAEIAAALLFLVGAFVAGWHVRGKVQQECPVIVRTDTLHVRETLTVTTPQYIERRAVDTVLVAVRDTVVRRDTAFVVVEREQRHYRAEDYEAWVSGYRPSLDSVRVFPETRYITTERVAERRRGQWCVTLGVQSGYGFTPKGWQPYAGVGVTAGFSF